MNRLVLTIALSAATAWSMDARSAPFILSGIMAEDADIILNLYSDGPTEALPYEQFGPFTVDASGEYVFYDARDAVSYFDPPSETFKDNDITVTVHDAPLNTNTPLDTLVGEADDAGEVQLEAGKEYWLVIQPYSQGNAAELFALVLEGPGDPSGAGFMRLPNFYSGRFSDDDPLTNVIPEFVGCADSYYEVSGPHRVDQTGNYYGINYTIFHEDAMPIAFAVYEGSFDPDNPYDNQIAVGPNGAQFFMESGKNYFIVVQPDCDIRTGPYRFVVMPPAESFLWTPFAGGSYADAAVPAQGALLDVLPDVGAVFMAWFTFANTPPGSGADDSDVGSAEQRWMVGFGTWDDQDNPVVNMTLFKTEGGIFNMPDDPANVPQTPVGTMQIDMNRQCEGGEGHYDLDSGPSGTVLFRRIANDNLRNCINQNPRPAPWFDWKAN